MSDPVTIGAMVGGGISALRGGNLRDVATGASLGAVGGGGYGALTGKGMAGNLISQGGVLGGGGGAFANPEMISPFTPQGIAGTQAMNPSLTGAASTGFLDSMTSKVSDFAKQNPMVTQTAANVALQNMLQPRQTPVAPQVPIVSSSQGQYQPNLPTGLMSQIRIPQYKY